PARRHVEAGIRLGAPQPMSRSGNDAGAERTEAPREGASDATEANDRGGLPLERRPDRCTDAAAAQTLLRASPPPRERDHEKNRELRDRIGVGGFTARDVGDVDAVAGRRVDVHTVESGTELLHEAHA